METWSDSIHRYLDDITYQLVAETGKPSDRYHLGKIILKRFRESPDCLLQIDGATDERDTFSSMLVKSVRCADAFHKLSIQRGDVIVLMAPNCLDLTAPLYAALYLGVAVACIDMNLMRGELLHMLNDTKPKFVFCLGSKASLVESVLKTLELEAEIATFGKEENFNTLPEFLDKFADNVNVENFQTEEFEPKETVAILISTSGSTGLPKVAALTHSNLFIAISYLWTPFKEAPVKDFLPIIVSPVQWLSATYHFIFAPILKYTRLQSSKPETQEHVYDLINKYKPTSMVLSPTFMVKLLKPGDREKCDFSSLKYIYLSGSAVFDQVIEEIKIVSPKASVYVGYGVSETAGMCMNLVGRYKNACGKPFGHVQYRLVDAETQQDILQPNVKGELWLKGPTVFKGYWNKPKETEDAFSKDGWFKTGDIFYRDENYNFFFVDRLKLLLKYRNHQISPAEIEAVVRQHKGVRDVAVTGIPDLECGDLPLACVVTEEGADVTEQQIHDFVKANLTDTKQLRGGVIFVKELPSTATGKVDRRKLKAFAIQSVNGNEN